MASSTEIPLVTLLPRAWIGFSRGPWRCVGLAALVLISASGPAVIGHDLRLAGSPWLNRLGDLSVLISLMLPLLPLLALLQLTDGLLPDRRDDRPQQSWRQLVHRDGLKVLALLGMLLGLNLLGLIVATLGLLLSLPFSALVLMACCRLQTPLISDSRRNMFPT